MLSKHYSISDIIKVLSFTLSDDKLWALPIHAPIFMITRLGVLYIFVKKLFNYYHLFKRILT